MGTGHSARDDVQQLSAVEKNRKFSINFSGRYGENLKHVVARRINGQCSRLGRHTPPKQPKKRTQPASAKGKHPRYTFLLLCVSRLLVVSCDDVKIVVYLTHGIGVGCAQRRKKKKLNVQLSVRLTDAYNKGAALFFATPRILAHPPTTTSFPPNPTSLREFSTSLTPLPVQYLFVESCGPFARNRVFLFGDIVVFEYFFVA